MEACLRVEGLSLSSIGVDPLCPQFRVRVCLGVRVIQGHWPLDPEHSISCDSDLPLDAERTKYDNSDWPLDAERSNYFGLPLDAKRTKYDYSDWPLDAERSDGPIFRPQRKMLECSHRQLRGYRTACRVPDLLDLNPQQQPTASPIDTALAEKTPSSGIL